MRHQILFLPLHDPLYIFAVLIAIILLSPFIFRLIKFPDVASFIIAGIIIGPYGLNILARDSSIELLGMIGLLYIMFVAGLELDTEKIKLSKRNSVIFGILTFSVPFLLGMGVSRYILQLNNSASLLVSIMFSTHTLVAYPIVRKLGINKDISVITAVGGTIITDTLVLMILSFITQTYSDKSLGFQIVKMLLLFGVYLFIIFYSYPKIARWFFKNIKRDRPVHFLFLLLMVSLSSVVSELLGIEAIIGAFAAGLALNRSIPKNSLLMHHVDFVGNILFIPVFLIGIGMLINTSLLFAGAHIWYVSLILIIVAILGKWLAAFFSQKILGFSANQRTLLFGLTSSHAAAAIAVILIGYKRQMIDETIFNSTVFIIMVSSLVAAFITEKYGKKQLISMNLNRDIRNQNRVLVPVSNPSSMANLVEIANSFYLNHSTEPIHLLSIVNDDTRTQQNLINIRKTLEKGISEFNNLNENMKVITRVDLNVSSGILRVAKEYMITDIVIGWGGRYSTTQKIFGSVFDHLYKSYQTLYGCDILSPLSKIEKLMILLPPFIENEPLFSTIINRLIKLPLKRNFTTEIIVYPEQDPELIKPFLPKSIKNINIATDTISQYPMEFHEQNILIVIFLLRKQSVAYNAVYNNRMKKYLMENTKRDFLLVVPGTPMAYL